VHPDDHAAMLADIASLLSGVRSTNREYRVVMQDGSVRWLNRRAELMRDGKGKPIKIHGVSIDIRERKRLEQDRQAFALKMASAQGAERQRIALELHDGMIQDLAALAVDLGRRVMAAPEPWEKVKEDYQEVQRRVVKAADAARQVAYELHPSELDDLGLENALRQYCEQFGHDHGIRVEFTSGNPPAGLKRDIATAIYKVAQEGLWNVAKHSKAKKAKVALEGTPDRIRLRVEDNGKGLHLPSLETSKGLGVGGMRERIELINGTFSITSKPGKGTRIVAEVPTLGGEGEFDE
jgi:signal transduction histidine kinase